MLQFSQTFIDWVATNWAVLVALFGSGATLSVFLQYVLHKFHVDSKKLAYTLLHLLAALTALSAYYLENTKALPVYAGLVIAAQTVHRFAVSPYYNKYVIPYLTFLSESSPQPATPYEAPITAQYEIPAVPQSPVEQAPAFVS